MDSKTEQLMSARKKLRNFKSMQRALRDDTSSLSQSASSLVENGRLSVNSLQAGKQDEMFGNSDLERSASQRSASNKDHDEGLMFAEDSLFNNNSPSISLAMDNDLICNSNDFESLKGELAQCRQEKQQLIAQLSELALSVVVKEKTALQQQLREAADISAERLVLIKNMTADLNDRNSRLCLSEEKIGKLQTDVDNLNMATQRQSEELEISRKEAVSWQSRVLRAQQDKNDAQERLKLCMKEAENVQAQLDEVKKQLRLKELYLKQLESHSASSSVSEQEVQNILAENEKLKKDLLRVAKECDSWKEEAKASREHYETYGTQLNQNVIKLSAKLDEVSAEKMSLESKVQSLEDQIELRNSLQNSMKKDVHQEPMLDSMESQSSQDNLVSMMEKAQLAERTVNELRNQLKIKEAYISTTEGKLNEVEGELKIKIEQLASVEHSLDRERSCADERRRHTEDVLTLSEQLQNEKATVSRAIAQNRELKEQLIELQDKLVVLAEESMERESGRLSALHLVEQLKAEINRYKKDSTLEQPSTSADNKQSLANGILPNFNPIRESMQNHDETSSTSSVCGSDAAWSQSEEARNHTEAELATTKQRLEEMRIDLRRVRQENEELRRIMEQNSEDENQNNIHVELGQAVERINALSADNEQLRNELEDLRKKFCNENESAVKDGSDSGCNEQTTSKIVNNHYDAPPSIAEKPLAWTELEARFTRVMTQNADLLEDKERLEHLILQLETENDTIGDYVTIYQHQRKLIRERMRDREQAVARLSFEKEKMQEKLTELQKTLLELLTERGLIHSHKVNAKESFSETNGKTRVPKMRSFSHSTVDEVSGEEMVMDAGNQYVYENLEQDGIEIGAEIPDEESGMCGLRENGSDQNLGVQKIMSLITELQDLERTRTLSPCNPNLHCGECRGKLINL